MQPTFPAAASLPIPGDLIPPPLRIEVIVLGAADALQAEAAGAHRLEVVSAMQHGGITPPAAVVQAITRACRVPAMVMVRPHARSFVYDEDDMRAVHESITMVRDAGAAGLVFGALTAGGEIDTARLEQVLRWADGLPVTFHRAFDQARDLAAAFDELGRYRGAVAQLLTSGGAATASEGRSVLRHLVQRWRHGGGIEPLVGAGVSDENLAALHADIGADQYHVGSGARIGSRFDADIDTARMARLLDVR